MMTPGETTGQIEVTVAGVLSTRHILETAAGPVGELVLPPASREGLFHGADGRTVVVSQTGWWKDEYELREGETRLGAAWLRGLLHRQILLDFRGQSYSLDPAGFWSRSWSLHDAAGRRLLLIAGRGVFRRGATLTVLDEIPLELLLFAYYLAYTRWQQDTAVTAAAVGAAN